MRTELEQRDGEKKKGEKKRNPQRETISQVQALGYKHESNKESVEGKRWQRRQKHSTFTKGEMILT